MGRPTALLTHGGPLVVMRTVSALVPGSAQLLHRKARRHITQTCFGSLCIVVLDDCLCNEGPALGRGRCLQDLPGLPLQWILQIGAENILLPALAHSSAQPGIIAAARS